MHTIVAHPCIYERVAGAPKRQHPCRSSPANQLNQPLQPWAGSTQGRTMLQIETITAVFRPSSVSWAPGRTVPPQPLGVS